MESFFINAGKMLAYIVLAVAIAWVAKLAFYWKSDRMDEDAELAKDNLAIGFRQAGLYFGGLIAMSGVLNSSSRGFAQDIFGILVFGALTYALLFIANIINDRFILPDVCNDDACRDNNVAVGVVECGGLIATGIIINGCVSGDSTSIVQGLGMSIMFFLLGQGMLVLLSFLFRWSGCIKAVEAGSVTAAVFLAGKLVAYSIILRASLARFQDWSTGLASFALAAIVGLIFLFLMSKIAQLVFLSRKKDSDDNLASMLIEQAVVIGTAMIIAVVI